jgi:hypothetical protein
MKMIQISRTGPPILPLIQTEGFGFGFGFMGS